MTSTFERLVPVVISTALALLMTGPASVASQLYDLYVADESAAKDICEGESDTSDSVDVSGFDEARQLSLLSVCRTRNKTMKLQEYSLPKQGPPVIAVASGTPANSDTKLSTGKTVAETLKDFEAKHPGLMDRLMRDAEKHQATDKSYYKYFKLLYPSIMGAECFVTKFPDAFVETLAGVKDSEVSQVAVDWMKIEPRFAEYHLEQRNVAELLKKIVVTCKTARNKNKHVLFRFSL